MDATECYAIADSLLKTGKQAQSVWEPVVRRVMPRLVNAAELQENMPAREERRRVCSYAATAVAKCSAAHLSLITPMSSKWFMYAPRVDADDGEDTSEDDKWYAAASEVAMKKLLQSNFYTEVCPTYTDRVATGTGLMLCEEDENGALVFTHVPAGTYGVAENNLHEVDKVARVLSFTAAQVVQEWGEEALTTKMRQAWEKPATRYVQEFQIWHVVVPRYGAINANKDVDPMLRMWKSVYLDPTEKKILHESGYFEFPFMCTRFERSGNQVYGDSPLVRVEPVINDNRNMNDIMVTGGQRLTMPSVIGPAMMIDEIDLRAGGKSVMPDEYSGMDFPRVVAPATQYQVGKDMIADYKAQIDDALFVSVLQNISQQDRYMTATEVQARQSEKLQTFTPSYCQMMMDFRPMHNRIFCILMRSGAISNENVPDGIFRTVQEGEFSGIKVLAPDVSYVGMMAQAFARAQGQDAQQAIADILNVCQAANDVEPLANIDFNAWARMRLIQSNAPSALLRSVEEATQRQEQMRQAAQQQAQADMQAKLAAAGRDQALGQQAYSNAQKTAG